MKNNNIKNNILNVEKSKEFNDKELWKYFFKRPLNNYNPYVYEMFNYDNLLFDENELIKNNNNWNKVFNNNNPISIEIGSGSGNFITELSYKNKEENFIAFEIRFKRLVSSAIKANKINLTNLLFVRLPKLNLIDIFSKNEINNFYMNFPEPWNGEEQKRLFSKDLLKTLNIIMKKGGKIYFKTDHLDYYNYVLELLNEDSNFKIEYKTEDLYNSDKLENNIKTEFEHLFINKLKETIKYIEAIKLN